jgi:ABC-type transport system involved in multi-copper enzyme maturation permease subunit
MRNAISSEWLKLQRRGLRFTLPVSLVVLALGSSFLANYSLFFGSHMVKQVEVINSLPQKEFLLSGFLIYFYFLGMCILVISAMSISTEYSLGTIKNVFINQPKRLTFLLGKGLSLAIYSSILFTITTFFSILSNVFIELIGGIHFHSLFQFNIIRFTAICLVCSYLSMLMYLAIGLSCGMIMKSPTISIAVPLLWMIVAEPVLASSIKPIARFLPGVAIAQLGNPKSFGTFSASFGIVLLLVGTISIAGVRSIKNSDI